MPDHKTGASTCGAGLKIPKFTKLKFDPDAERRARAPAVEQWRIEFPHYARAYDEAISSGRGGRIKLGDFERIARGHPRRRGKGRGENRDALARSPTGGGRFVDGGEGDWSDHDSATRSDDSWDGDPVRNLEDPMYDPEDDPRDDPEADPMYDQEGDPMYDHEEDDDSGYYR